MVVALVSCRNGPCRGYLLIYRSRFYNSLISMVWLGEFVRYELGKFRNFLSSYVTYVHAATISLDSSLKRANRHKHKMMTNTFHICNLFHLCTTYKSPTDCFCSNMWRRDQQRTQKKCWWQQKQQLKLSSPQNLSNIPRSGLAAWFCCVVFNSHVFIVTS
jgi:regulator of replication initiation timing